jgi:hypothetical protein
MITSSTKGPSQLSGSSSRQHFRHAAVLEVARQQGEADQQAEQVDQQHPLVRHVRPKPARPSPVLKPVK